MRADRADFEPSPDCRHAADVLCRRCTPLHKAITAFELPDLRNLVASGKYRATRHRDGRGHELLEITPVGKPEEIVVFELHASRVA
jgi:hypothetical protein